MKDYEALSKKHFDGQAAQYDAKDTAFYSKYPKISCRDVAKRLEIVAYEKLLDVGCGTGFLIDLLKKQRKADYFGLDLSPEMLKQAKKKFGTGVPLSEGSADSLPYADASFDVVTCVQSFHHYPYPEKAMREAFRVLKPGGLYILSDTGCSGFIKWFYNRILLPNADTGDYRLADVEDISKMMTDAGFRVKQAEKIRRQIYTVTGEKP